MPKKADPKHLRAHFKSAASWTLTSEPFLICGAEPNSDAIVYFSIWSGELELRSEFVLREWYGARLVREASSWTSLLSQAFSPSFRTEVKNAQLDEARLRQSQPLMHGTEILLKATSPGGRDLSFAGGVLNTTGPIPSVRFSSKSVFDCIQ